MIAEKDGFNGSLNDICDYLEINRTSRNRSKIKSILLQEAEDNLIKSTNLSSNISPSHQFTLEIIPKETEIILDEEWLKISKMREAQYSRSVDWTALLKVILWVLDYYKDSSLVDMKEFINKDISDDISLSSSTVTDAKKVLENDFGALEIKKNYIVGKNDNEIIIRVVGQQATTSAWVAYPTGRLG